MWRLSVPLLLLLFAASGGRGQVAGEAIMVFSAPSQVDVVGELQFLNSHITDTSIWTIRDSDGKMTPIASGFQPPPKDDYGRAIVPGAVVVLPCYIDPSGVCNPIPELKMTVISDTSSTIMANTEPIYQRLLVIILDYSACNYPASLQPADVTRVWLGPDDDGRGCMAQMFTQCSYGKFNLNTTAFRAITVRGSCTTAAIEACSAWDASVIGESGAKEQLGDDVFSTFTHFAYIMPPKMRDNCNWAGLASLPGKNIWLQTGYTNMFLSGTILQETFHNYGLWHSWRFGLEYEDYSTPMGRGNVCLSASESSYMGWSSAAEGGDAIDSSILTQPGATLSFVLPATYITGDGNFLRVKPDWLSTYGNASAAKNLYIAVRVNKGGDLRLDTMYANRVHVHEVNATLDNDVSGATRYVKRRTSIIGLVTPLSRFDLTDYKLSVYGGSWVETDTLRVHLCRYEVTPQECPGVQTLEVFPSPRRAHLNPPPSPPPSRRPPPSFRPPPGPRPPPKPPAAPRVPTKPPSVRQQASPPPPQARSSPPPPSPSSPPRSPPKPPSPRARRAAGRRRPA
ncbi:hypothetical protein Vretimale_10504 [Volvox reticuliferus]|uniref:Peptidase M11 gametolysin domain-containing protein n=1 Tax=Volvox reticuliferus TaxID=1737510 RepID=A0A8J4LQH4_9CHLO|nr:hypothetical protein Vretimale_10504 [Volvox reticuliferus]